MDLPARDVPVPAHLSEAAQASLGVRFPTPQAYPQAFDHEAWRSLIATRDARMLSMAPARPVGAATIETVDLGTAEPHVIEAGPHGGFQDAAPEDREIGGEIQRFFSDVGAGAIR